MILALAVLLTSVNAGGVSSWRLVWHDEFDGLALDRTKWTNEVGFVRNRELQYYTDCRENVRLEDGFLVLEARKERF